VNTIYELNDLWQFLKRQEIRIMELDRRLYALLQVIKANRGLFDSYQATYDGLASSNIVLEHTRRIEEVEESMRQLGIQSAENDCVRQSRRQPRRANTSFK
jgi:hypothetical protein